MLGWIFGELKENKVHVHSHDRAAGYLEFEKARVRWFLSINADTLPQEIKDKGQRTFRSISIEGEELEFSTGFTELHTESYKNILSGNGFSIDDNRSAIAIVHDIRNQTPLGLTGDYHPLANTRLTSHPFTHS